MQVHTSEHYLNLYTHLQPAKVLVPRMGITEVATPGYHIIRVWIDDAIEQLRNILDRGRRRRRISRVKLLIVARAVNHRRFVFLDGCSLDHGVCHDDGAPTIHSAVTSCRAENDCWRHAPCVDEEFRGKLPLILCPGGVSKRSAEEECQPSTKLCCTQGQWAGWVRAHNCPRNQLRTNIYLCPHTIECSGII